MCGRIDMGAKGKRKIEVVCPWCEKGKTQADRLAEVNVSCQCKICGNVYKANLQTLRTTKIKTVPSKRGG